MSGLVHVPEQVGTFDVIYHVLVHLLRTDAIAVLRQVEDPARWCVRHQHVDGAEHLALDAENALGALVSPREDSSNYQ